MAIHTISEFLEEISDFKSIISHDKIYFRGQNNGFEQGWKLLPTFYREKIQYSEIPFYIDKKVELNTIYKFVEKNFDYFKSIDFNDLISIINILQHYGFPTRVLDVTQNPLVALYFALEKVESGDGNAPVIYLLYVEKVSAAYLINNDIREFYDEIESDKKRLHPAVLVNGCVLSERIRSQKGDFIFFYDETDISKDSTFRIEEIKIDIDSIGKLKNELELLGISESTIYPSLATQTKKLKDELLNSYKINQGTQGTKNVLSSALEDKREVTRKYLSNKKMFVGIKPVKKSR